MDVRKTLTIALFGMVLAPGVSHGLDARAYVDKAIALRAQAPAATSVRPARSVRAFI